MKKALIVWGGWDGHQPKETAELLKEILKAEAFDVEVTNNYKEAFADAEKLKSIDLIVPCITMDKAEGEWVKNVSDAVAAGTGMAGCHGGMGDTFRDNTDWHMLVGGQFISHPGNAENTYAVNFKNSSSPLNCGLEDFTVTSEQYYMHVDPSNDVLAVTPFPTAEGHHTANGHFEMPVAWTRRWGKGRIYYNSLGHTPDTISSGTAREMISRGFLWAARDDQA